MYLSHGESMPRLAAIGSIIYGTCVAHRQNHTRSNDTCCQYQDRIAGHASQAEIAETDSPAAREAAGSSPSQGVRAPRPPRSVQQGPRRCPPGVTTGELDRICEEFIRPGRLAEGTMPFPSTQFRKDRRSAWSIAPLYRCASLSVLKRECLQESRHEAP